MVSFYYMIIGEVKLKSLSGLKEKSTNNQENSQHISFLRFEHAKLHRDLGGEQ